MNQDWALNRNMGRNLICGKHPTLLFCGRNVRFQNDDDNDSLPKNPDTNMGYIHKFFVSMSLFSERPTNQNYINYFNVSMFSEFSCSIHRCHSKMLTSDDA